MVKPKPPATAELEMLALVHRQAEPLMSAVAFGHPDFDDPRPDQMPAPATAIYRHAADDTYWRVVGELSGIEDGSAVWQQVAPAEQSYCSPTGENKRKTVYEPV